MYYSLPDHAKDYPMRVLCAWCHKLLYWARCVKPNETSHGICDDCKAEQFEPYPDQVGLFEPTTP